MTLVTSVAGRTIKYKTRAITVHDHTPTSALSYSRFWSQDGEWFSKGRKH